MKLLLAEDEKELSRALIHILSMNGYEAEPAYDGMSALLMAESGEYDALILDWMMPKMDGLTVLKKLREEGKDIPVLFLTARSEIDDRVEGLDAGANDYLTKPFAMKEFLARIRVLLRGREKEEKAKGIVFANAELDPETHFLTVDGKEVRLTQKEYGMAEILFLNPHRTISGEQFMEKVWGFDTDADLNVIWVTLSNLRKKLSGAGAKITVKAVRGLGYMVEENND